MKRFAAVWVQKGLMILSVPKEHACEVMNAVKKLPFIDCVQDTDKDDTQLWVFPSQLMEKSDLPELEAVCRGIVGDDE